MLVLVVAVVVALAAAQAGTRRSRTTVRRRRSASPGRRAMTREPTPPGAMLLLDQHDARGLVASFEVTPLRAAALRGRDQRPAAGRRDQLPAPARAALRAGRVHAGSLGRTRIINTPAFTFTYSRVIHGDHLLRPLRLHHAGADGRSHRAAAVDAAARGLAAAGTAPAEPTPDAVGTRAPLQEPLVHLRIS